MKYEILTRLENGNFENTWRYSESRAVTYNTLADAKAALNYHLKDLRHAVKKGYLIDAPTRHDYKIAPVLV